MVAVAELRRVRAERQEQRHRERQLGAALAVAGHVGLARLDVGEGGRRDRGQRADHRDRHVHRLGDGAALAVVEGDLLVGAGDVLDDELHLEPASSPTTSPGFDALTVEVVLDGDLEGQVAGVVADGPHPLLAVDGHRGDLVAVHDVEAAEAVEVAGRRSRSGSGGPRCRCRSSRAARRRAGCPPRPRRRCRPGWSRCWSPGRHPRRRTPAGRPSRRRRSWSR